MRNLATASVAWAGLDSRLGTFLGAFVFALLTTPAVIATLHRLRLMDHPNERSSHVKATVRGAGWGVLFGVLAGWFASMPAGALTWWLPAAAVAYALIGFVDDLRSLPANVRFGLQIVVSSGALVALRQIDAVPVSTVVLAAGTLLIVAYVNAFNFMDGVNAISGLQAAVVGGILAGAGADAGALDVQYAGLAIAGAALGFLPFNAVRARCFLGDVGSYFIGAWIALTCVVAYGRGVSWLTIACVVAIYGSDTALTLVKRVRRGERWWTPHREHVYQRLTDAGLSHLASACTVSVFTALVGLAGLAANGASNTGMAALGFVALLGCGLYAALPGVATRRGLRSSAHAEPLK